MEWYRTHRVPVYSTTGKINSLQLRRLVHTALDSVDRIREPVPEPVRAARGLLDRAAALELVHRPGVDDQPSRGLDRLKYDEAFVLQTILAQRRKAAESELATPRPPRPGGLLADFDARLPFELTAGQREIGEVLDGRARLRPADAPAAAGRGRLGQDRRRPAGHARRDRRGRAGRAARPHRGAGGAAPPLDHGDARRPRARRHARRRRARHDGGAAHGQPERGARKRCAARPRRPARPASSSARTPSSRSTCSSPTSPWSSSTSSTGSASSSATPCARRGSVRPTCSS